MMKKLLILTLVLTIGSTGSCYNILGVFPHSGKSHFDIFEPLMKALANKGHKVTVLSHFPQKDSILNYEDVSLKGTSEIFLNVIDLDVIGRSRLKNFFAFLNLLSTGQETCVTGLSSQVVVDFLKGTKKFDLIIVEYFYNDCFLGFVHKYQVPFVGITTSVFLSWHNSKVGNIGNPSYVPNNFVYASDRMSFFERLESTVAGVVQDLVYDYYYVDILNEGTAKRVFGDDLPHLRDISKNVSLILVNSHFSLNRPRPLAPGVVEIGGIHIGKAKILPKVK